MADSEAGVDLTALWFGVEIPDADAIRQRMSDDDARRAKIRMKWHAPSKRRSAIRREVAERRRK
mgnify:CR=1 FL=1